jgi:general secretion pathway protein G
MKPMNKKALNSRGFSLIELAVVVSVIGVLAAVLLDRMLFYQEQAEKAAMEQMAGTLRSALHLQTASLFAKSRADDIPRLLKQNPMNWLAEKPVNYRGEYFAPKPQDIEPGSWYFDLQSGELVYLVNNDQHFHIDERERNRVRFRTRLVTSIQEIGKSDDKTIEGATLDAVVPYKWF